MCSWDGLQLPPCFLKRDKVVKTKNYLHALLIKIQRKTSRLCVISPYPKFHFLNWMTAIAYLFKYTVTVKEKHDCSLSHPDVDAGCWIWRAAYVPAVDVHCQLKGWHPLRLREGAEQCHLLIFTDPVHTGPGQLLQLQLFQLYTWTSGFSLEEGLRGNRWDNSTLMDSLRWGDTGTGMDWIGLDRSGLIRVRKHWSVTSWSCQYKKMSICFDFLLFFHCVM